MNSPNSPVTFPPPRPELKLSRSTEKWAATLAEERRRLQDDQDALRERESNLKEYEARLRAWQAEIDAGQAVDKDVHQAPAASAPLSSLHRASKAPFAEDPALQLAWEKLHRARELLEAEQTHLRDDRIAIREQAEAVKRREEAVAACEAKLAEREALILAATPPPKPSKASKNAKSQPIAGEHTIGMSAVSMLTRGPFDMARNVFGGKK